MVVCVECGDFVNSLYTEYGHENICLTQCNTCKKFADKYVEFDKILIFIDMMLHKPSVYRHLLLNRKDGNDNKSVIEDRINANNDNNKKSCDNPNGNFEYDWKSRFPLPKEILKLGLLLILFDVYTKWSKAERVNGYILMPFLPTYSFYIVICMAELLLFHITVFLFCKWILSEGKVESKKQSRLEKSDNEIEIEKRCNLIPLALTIAGFGKLLHVFMVIWNYEELYYSWIVNAFVMTSQAEAISILFKWKYYKSYLILGIALTLKYIFQRLIGIINPDLPVNFL